jgi:hypothetical protein
LTLEEATKGFRNQGQFIAALNAAKNHNLDFVALQEAMTVDGMSLGQAAKKVANTPPPAETPDGDAGTGGTGTGSTGNGQLPVRARRGTGSTGTGSTGTAPERRSSGRPFVTRRVLPPAIGLIVAFGLLIPGAAYAQGNGRPKGPKAPTPTTSTPSTRRRPLRRRPIVIAWIRTSSFRQFGSWLDDASSSYKGDSYASLGVGYWRLAESSQVNAPMLGMGGVSATACS